MRPLLLLLCCLPTYALAVGEPLGPDPDREWEGNLDYAATAATLIDCGAAVDGCGAPCAGLDQSTAVLDVIPVSDTLTIEYAQLNWFASTPMGVGADPQVALAAPGAAPFAVDADAELSEGFDDGLPGDQCGLVQLLCPAAVQCQLTFYSAFADVTDQIEAHRAGGGTLNGEWTLSEATISGSNGMDPGTAIASVGSLTIGGWSLVVVYRDDANLPLRRVYYYQGFELNEGQNRTVRPRGFRAPNDAAVDLTYLVLEGDSGTSGDQLQVNGRSVQDACNPDNNVFNSTVNTGRADGMCQTGVDGVDLDSFHVEGALDPGDTEADITFVVPRGDGLFTAGEQIFTNWLVLAFDHIPPNFSDVKPQKRSAPPGGAEVSRGDHIEYIIEVENTGGETAETVMVIDDAPEGTVYLPASASVNGRPIVDAVGGGCPFAGLGFELTSLPEIDGVAPGDRHLVRFSVEVTGETDVTENVAYIDTPGVPRAETLPVRHVVVDGPPREDMGPGEPDMAVPLDGDVIEAPRPDAGVVEADQGPARDATVEADVPRLTPDSGSGACPVGEREVAGQCRPVCGAGLVYNAACGEGLECRPESAPGCERSGNPSGCGCRADDDGAPTPLLLLALASLVAVRRRR